MKPIAVIPAAGRGTRLLPLTKAVPKELLPLGTVPALQFVLEEVHRAGLRDVLLVVHPEKEALRRYCTPRAAEAGSPAELFALEALLAELSIHFVVQAEPRGLGDAVRVAAEAAPGRPLAVLLPDEVYPRLGDGLERLMGAPPGELRILLRRVPREETSRFGIVGGEEEGGTVRLRHLVEKPRPEEAPSDLAIMGRYLLPPAILPHLRALKPGAGGELQLTDALQAALSSGTVGSGVIDDGLRLDLGDARGYREALAVWLESSG